MKLGRDGNAMMSQESSIVLVVLVVVLVVVVVGCMLDMSTPTIWCILPKPYQTHNVNSQVINCAQVA